MLLKAFTRAFLLLVVPLHSDSCRNDFESFQEIFQTRQQSGRIRRRIGLAISTQLVVTKMACLDACLRTVQCASFDVKITRPDKNGLRYWACKINRQEPKSLELVARESGWRHVNVSSWQLQEVSELGCVHNKIVPCLLRHSLDAVRKG